MEFDLPDLPILILLFLLFLLLSLFMLHWISRHIHPEPCFSDNTRIDRREIVGNDSHQLGIKGWRNPSKALLMLLHEH